MTYIRGFTVDWTCYNVITCNQLRTCSCRSVCVDPSYPCWAGLFSFFLSVCVFCHIAMETQASVTIPDRDAHSPYILSSQSRRGVIPVQNKMAEIMQTKILNCIFVTEIICLHYGYLNQHGPRYLMLYGITIPHHVHYITPSFYHYLKVLIKEQNVCERICL